MLKFILFVLAGAVIYVLFSYVLRLFNLSDDLINNTSYGNQKTNTASMERK